MSASREKRTRQDLQSSGYVDPRIEEKAKKQAADHRSNTLITVGIIVFVLIAAALILWNSGVFKKPVTALTADGEAFTVEDMNYQFFTSYSSFLNNYGSNLETFGLDTNTDLREQSCPLAAEGTTWYDYFRNQAAENLSKAVAVYHKAQKEGFEDKDAVKQALSEAWSTIDQYAANNKTDRATTLQMLFGNGMTKKIFERNVRLEAIVTAYSNHYLDSVTFTDDDFNKAYEKSPTDYQSAEAEYIYFAPEETEEGDEDAAAAATAKIKENAEAAVKRYNAGETLEAIAADLGGEYVNGVGLSGNTGAFSDWLFDSARKDGDIAAIDGGSYYLTALFHGVSKNDFHAVDVRHILVEDEATAKSILDTWEKGAKTEDSFAKLAKENSSDGSASNGGLYEDIVPGKMVKAFNDWCFDEARKEGDTDIVKTEYGYHVMYFVAKNALPYWKEQAQASMKNDAYQTWYTEQTKDAKWEKGEGFDSIWH